MSKLIDYWKNIFIGKNENSPAFRREMAKKLDKKQLKYVSQRIDDNESVICHAGYITLVGDDLVVSSNEKGTVFRAKVEELAMNELLSMEGVILTGNDIEHNDEYRSIIAYYTYYRKVDNR